MDDRRGFFQLRNHWAKHTLRHLTSPELRVYLVLRAYRNSGTGKACPSLKTLSAQAGISRSQVQVALDRLEERCLIERDKMRWGNTGRYAHNDYRVLDEDQGTNTGKQVMAQYRKTGNGEA